MNYARVKATGEIVEVEREVYELDDYGIGIIYREVGTNRVWEPGELAVPTEQEVNLFLLCPDVYMDNLKKGRI